MKTLTVQEWILDPSGYTRAWKRRLKDSPDLQEMLYRKNVVANRYSLDDSWYDLVTQWYLTHKTKDGHTVQEVLEARELAGKPCAIEEEQRGVHCFHHSPDDLRHQLHDMFRRWLRLQSPKPQRDATISSITPDNHEYVMSAFHQLLQSNSDDMKALERRLAYIDCLARTDLRVKVWKGWKLNVLTTEQACKLLSCSYDTLKRLSVDIQDHLKDPSKPITRCVQMKAANPLQERAAISSHYLSALVPIDERVSVWWQWKSGSITTEEAYTELRCSRETWFRLSKQIQAHLNDPSQLITACARTLENQ